MYTFGEGTGVRALAVRYEHSAGGVLFKGDEVLLVLNPSHVWTFPKGLVERGERPEETAVREVYEETGIRGKVLKPLGYVEYWYTMEGEKIKKRVDYFLMEYEDGQLKPSWEVKDARFFSVDEAKRVLKYKGDREVFERAVKGA